MERVIKLLFKINKYNYIDGNLTIKKYLFTNWWYLLQDKDIIIIKYM